MEVVEVDGGGGGGGRWSWWRLVVNLVEVSGEGNWWRLKISTGLTCYKFIV